jgi:hypothetical protein
MRHLFLLALLAVAAEKPFTVEAKAVAAKVREPAAAKVVFVAAAGWHINREYPTSLRCTPPESVKLAKSDLTKTDATISEKEGRFEVTATALSAGRHVISCTLAFAVSTLSSADPERVSVEIVLDAK